jgi:anti-sigma B factor antagonist
MEFQRIVIRTRRLDGTSAALLAAEFDAAWRTGARVVALDLSAVEEIHSLGISALISQHRKRPGGSRIVLCGLTEYVRDIFEITQLHRVFDVFDSTVAAEISLCA